MATRLEGNEESDGSLSSMSEADCVILSRAGDRAAQEELVNRYLGRIYGFLSRCLGDRELAADSTQEVFLRLFRALHTFDPRRGFRPWIFAIAWNAACDQIRRLRARRENGNLPRSMGTGEAVGEEGREPADRRAPGPAEALERKERSELVRRALRRLEPRQRALLLLREFEGLSYGELAHLLETNVGTIKSGLHRARLELKDALLRLQPGLPHEL